ncbi:cutinase family protein [Enterococcus termitis]|uniref:Fungal lipase-like domain-containing protein n=3 Tax=Enterococcus termitis TaxID=332950 RepID=A0A1E5GAN3_9ENTE|nr:cutinase family protein [Enterococcus termitis]OEG09764.1 hypothetical protein BCR25_09650 [Enterococcus termitis]
MSNLESFNNIYANLAESAYTGRPNSFPSYRKDKKEREFDFSENKTVNGELTTGGKNLPNEGIVYLQPDNTVKTVTEKKFFGEDKEYQKGLLTDEKAGYNSYYVTDTPTLNTDTKHTYFTTRGSDGASTDVKKGWAGNNLNDWVNNNASFAVGDAYIPQAKLATEAMHQKIKEMGTKAPNATMSMTGHSLGTMVTIQAVANLPAGDIEKIDKVILFQGPDARESINKMSKQAQANIQRLEEQGRIEYYVNAFDIVSMLNRNKKGVDEIGKVHYLLPKSFNTTFDAGKNGSSHDFGQYQLNPDGTLKEANLKDHGYIFTAGIKLSKLIDKYMNKLLATTGEGVSSGAFWAAIAGDAYLYKKFMKEYDKIVADAKVASEWQGNVASLQGRIRGASGSKKIELRGELATEVANKAKTVGEEYVLIQKNDQQEAEDEVDLVVQEIREGALSIQQSLESYEVEALIAPYKKNNLWDSGQATSNINEAKKYKEKLTAFSKTLTTVAKNIQEYDGTAGKNIFTKK